MLSVFDYCIYISLIPKRNKTPNSLSTINNTVGDCCCNIFCTINKYTSKTSYNIYRVTHKVSSAIDEISSPDQSSSYNISSNVGTNN